MTNEAGKSKRRPIGVWVISAFYMLSAVWTTLSFALVFSGAMKINPPQESYFASLTGVDWFFTFASGVITVSAALCLFLLRKIAITLFLVSLAFGVAFTAFHTMRDELD